VHYSLHWFCHRPFCSALIVRRFALKILFQKSLCVLHRRVLVLARSNLRYLYLRKSCVDAAMQLPSHQSVIHNECQPGGLLQRDKWKVASLMGQGFLLAAMIICLEFDHLKTHSHSQDGRSAFEEVRSEEIMLRALQTSYNIWNEFATSSMATLKVSTVLKMILEKVTRLQVTRFRRI
jgi:hypothetical protein